MTTTCPAHAIVLTAPCPLPGVERPVEPQNASFYGRLPYFVFARIMIDKMYFV
jgi:hypothetical protein